MNYWQKRWEKQQTGWDLGEASPPLITYLSQISEAQRSQLNVLMPGCGNGYEAIWMIKNGFQHVTMLDIAPTAVEQMQERVNRELELAGPQPQLLCGDFFEHTGNYDLILEQTFFCALDPSLRDAYVQKMHHLLNPGGKLVGVLFDRAFEGGPPFGGDREEYAARFAPFFHFKTWETCQNSAVPRTGTELFMILEKHKD